MHGIVIEEYLQKMLHEQTTKERANRNPWARNPLTGEVVQDAPEQQELDRTAKQLKINMRGY